MAVPPEPWQRVANGWQRRLYGGEVAFASFGTIPLTNSHPSGHGHSSLLIETTLTSSRPPSISEVTGKLQDAWKQVRYHAHPLIAVELVLPQVITDTDDYIVYYPDTTPESATIWAQETVIYQPSLHMADLVHAVDSKIYSSGSSGAEIHFSYLPGIGGDDSTLHLVFAAGHWITDRRGAFKILDRLVGYLNSSSSIDLDWGAEVSRLSLPLGVATGRRQANAGNIEHLASGDIETFMHTFMHAHAKAQPSHEKPLQPASIIMPSPQIRSDIVLSETDSHKLLNLCRHHSTTVTALLNVLLAMTYVDNPVKLRSSKTLPIPFFAVHRSHDLVSPYKEGMGLYITIAPFAFAASSIAKCLDGQDEQNKAIWGAAQEAKHQLLAAKSSEPALVFDHETISALLPSLRPEDGRPFFGADLLFATSVGSITAVFSPPTSSSQWIVRHVANGFVVRWYRTVVHYWKWQGKTTIRVVGSSQYHSQEDIDVLANKILYSIRAVLDTPVE